MSARASLRRPAWAGMGLDPHTWREILYSLTDIGTGTGTTATGTPQKSGHPYWHWGTRTLAPALPLSPVFRCLPLCALSEYNHLPLVLKPRHSNVLVHTFRSRRAHTWHGTHISHMRAVAAVHHALGRLRTVVVMRCGTVVWSCIRYKMQLVSWYMRSVRPTSQARTEKRHSWTDRDRRMKSKIPSTCVPAG